MTTLSIPNTNMLPPSYDERPPYSPSLESYGLALFKIERKTPWSDESTSLQPVILELNSNQLRIYLLSDNSRTQLLIRALYRYQNGCDGKDVSDEWDSSDDDDEEDLLTPKNSSGLLTRLKDKALRAKLLSVLKSQLLPSFCDNQYLFEPTDSAAKYKKFFDKHKGELLHVCTLLNLSIGKAPFLGLLKKRKLLDTKNNPALLHDRNVLRLRVEHMQILLHFWSFHGMVHWFRNFLIGRDLAQLIDHRRLLVLKSVSSSPLLLDEGSFSETKPATHHMRHPSTSSEESLRNSLFSGQSADTFGDEVAARNYVTIMGHDLYCLEDAYTYFEKRYIGRCLPILNSFDKWQGSKMALSNFDLLGLESDGKFPEVDGQMYILGRKFNKAARSLSTSSSGSSGQGVCKEFYVYQLGLYTCKEKKQT